MFRCSGICSKCKACGDIQSMEILEDFKLSQNFKADEAKGLGLAIDIGTTTIATALWDLKNTKLISQKTAVNPQRNFGGDIVSRVAYAMKSEENFEQLRESLINKINGIIYSYMEDYKKEDGIKDLDVNENNKVYIGDEVLEKVYLSGNRVMMNILMGRDIKEVSSYPYKPNKIYTEKFVWKVNARKENEFKYLGDIKATVIGSSYSNIGGDIVSGLVAIESEIKNQNILFLDLGTNGECILKRDDKYVGFSVAAGPAFEGGNIQDGVFAQKGAISKVSILNDKVTLEYLGGEKPEKSVGICGSALIFSIGEMLRNKIIDYNGVLVNYDYFARFNPYSSLKDRIENQKFVLLSKEENKNKEIALYQKDIREFQLAKGAIKSGIELAFKDCDISLDSIDKIILAGGFAKSIDKQTLLACDIIPNMSGDLVFMGNTSLAGCSMIMMSENEEKKAMKLSEDIEVIELSMRSDFQEKFVEALNFQNYS